MPSGEFLAPAEKLSHVEAAVMARPEIVGLQNYEYFRNNSADFKADFIAGDRDATITYPELQTGQIYELAQDARDTLVTLMPGEDTDKTRGLYRAIEYRYSEMFLVALANQLRNPDLTVDGRYELLQEFKAASEALYGKPDQAVFSALEERHIFSVFKGYGLGSRAERIQDELSSLLGHGPKSEYTPYRPDEAEVQQLHDIIQQKFGPVVEHIDPEKTYEVPDIKEALEEVMHKLGGDELGWQVVIMPDASSLSTSPHQKQIWVGENRKPVKGDELRGLAMHECGVHALRSINALKAGWLSAAYGQEGYLAFEEGLATALEDAYKGKFEDHGINHYLVAGLAYGLDGHKGGRDFSEVYEIMWRVNALQSVPEGGEVTAEEIGKAQIKAFTSCMRLFRGTQLSDRGVIYLKDLAYFDGQELAWSVLKHVKSVEDLDFLLAGKLDFTKPDHVAIAEQIREVI